MSQTTIYNWIRQDKIDHGEIDGLSPNQQVELAAAKKRIRQLKTELADGASPHLVGERDHRDPQGLPWHLWSA